MDILDWLFYFDFYVQIFVYFKFLFDFIVTFLISRSYIFAGEFVLFNFEKNISIKSKISTQNVIPTISQIEMITFS